MDLVGLWNKHIIYQHYPFNKCLQILWFRIEWLECRVALEYVTKHQVLQVFTLEGGNHPSKHRVIPGPLGSTTVKETSLAGSQFYCGYGLFFTVLKEGSLVRFIAKSAQQFLILSSVQAEYRCQELSICCDFHQASSKQGAQRQLSCFNSQPDR